MKYLFPKTKIEWMQFVLLPFKFYVVLIPLVFIILMIESGKIHLDNLLISNQIHLMIMGYILCIITLTLGGIFTAILTRNRKLMLSGLIYAVIGLFVLLMFLLPSLATTRQK